MAGSDLVQSLDRGLMIVEILAATEDGLSVQAVAEQLGVSSPTAHNLLRTLAARGWVERREKPVRYSVGSQLGELAGRAEGRGLRQRLQLAMAELAAQMPADVWVFAEPVDGEIVGTLQAARGGAVVARQGAPQAPYAAATALAYQAWCWPADQLSYRQAHPFAEFGAGLWRDEAELESFLAASRAAGHVAPALPAGHVRVAVPVLAADGRLLGTLGGFQPCDPTDHSATAARLVAALQRALDQIHPTGETHD